MVSAGVLAGARGGGAVAGAVPRIWELRWAHSPVLGCRQGRAVECLTTGHAGRRVCSFAEVRQKVQKEVPGGWPLLWSLVLVLACAGWGRRSSSVGSAEGAGARVD